LGNVKLFFEEFILFIVLPSEYLSGMDTIRDPYPLQSILFYFLRQGLAV
jgi:hypothetical protein